MKEKISKLKNVYKKDGLKGFLKKIKAYLKANYLDRFSFKVFFNQRKYRLMIRDILTTQYDRIIIFRSSFGYNVPLFQRPQHITNQLAKNNSLVFYEITTMTDSVKTFHKQSDNLYLFNFNNKLLNKILMTELNNIDKPKYIEIYSTDWRLSLNDINKYLDNGFKMIYEYIDHISPVLAGTNTLPKNISDKYEFAINNKEVYIVVTADLLKEDIVSKRGKSRLIFSTNGVDYEFFKKIDEDYEFEEEFNDILDKNKPIICYYGALANWFDYDLIKKIAKTDKYSIVLFGVKYDESYNLNIKNTKNIYFLGTRDYKVLKNYANKADVLIIPFKINDITKATSPVKIFEYMALHKPIVTTDMNECRKYQSVLIGENHKEFLIQLENALDLKNNKDYIKLLDKEAKENDWSKKAKAIIDELNKNENQY